MTVEDENVKIENRTNSALDGGSSQYVVRRPAAASRALAAEAALHFSLFTFHFSIPSGLWAWLALGLAMASTLGAGADTVQTVDARLEGTMEVRDGGMRIAGATLPLGEVLTAIRDAGANTISAAQAIRMINGELWCGSIVGMETNAVTFRGDLFGEHAIATETVAA